MSTISIWKRILGCLLVLLIAVVGVSQPAWADSGIGPNGGDNIGNFAVDGTTPSSPIGFGSISCIARDSYTLFRIDAIPNGASPRYGSVSFFRDMVGRIQYPDLVYPFNTQTGLNSPRMSVDAFVGRIDLTFKGPTTIPGSTLFLSGSIFDSTGGRHRISRIGPGRFETSSFDRNIPVICRQSERDRQPDSIHIDIPRIIEDIAAGIGGALSDNLRRSLQITIRAVLSP